MKMNSGYDEKYLKFEPFRAKLEEIPAFQEGYNGNIGTRLEIRPVDLETDLSALQYWFNLTYTKQYWQMDGLTKADLKEHYQQKMAAGRGTGYMILIGQRPVAYFELYRPARDEIGDLYGFEASDMGLHFLLGPPKEVLGALPGRIRYLSSILLVLAVDYIFSRSDAQRVFAEPDVGNLAANDLARRVGFRFVKLISLSYKKANLYLFQGAFFYSKYPCSLKDKSRDPLIQEEK